jgi:hypothetical protein
VCFCTVLKISFSNSLPAVDKMLDLISGEILGPCRVSAELRYLVPSLVSGSDQAESRNWTNVLNAQEVSLEDGGNIHLDSFRNHRSFLISRIGSLLNSI